MAANVASHSKRGPFVHPVPSAEAAGPEPRLAELRRRAAQAARLCCLPRGCPGRSHAHTGGLGPFPSPSLRRVGSPAHVQCVVHVGVQNGLQVVHAAHQDSSCRHRWGGEQPRSSASSRPSPRPPKGRGRPWLLAVLLTPGQLAQEPGFLSPLHPRTASIESGHPPQLSGLQNWLPLAAGTGSREGHVQLQTPAQLQPCPGQTFCPGPSSPADWQSSLQGAAPTATCPWALAAQSHAAGPGKQEMPRCSPLVLSTSLPEQGEQRSLTSNIRNHSKLRPVCAQHHSCQVSPCRVSTQVNSPKEKEP